MLCNVGWKKPTLFTGKSSALIDSLKPKPDVVTLRKGSFFEHAHSRTN